MKLSPKHTMWWRGVRRWMDRRNINRNIGYIARIRDGTLVKVAIVTTRSPLKYIE